MRDSEKPKQGVKSPEPEIIVSSEMPDMAAGN